MVKKKLLLISVIFITIIIVSTSFQCRIAGEAPALELKIYAGPDYSESDNMCYYRVEAVVSGSPDPEVTFGDDDNIRPLGFGRAEVAVEEGKSHSLTATASNLSGTATATIILQGECLEVAAEDEEDEPGEENGEADDQALSEYPECPFPEGLVLPQVNIIASAYYLQADLDALQTNVIEPLIAYFESEGQTVVSIEIDSDDRGSSEKSYFLVSVIVSKNDGTRDPGHMGFMHEKVDGQIPLWEMEIID